MNDTLADQASAWAAPLTQVVTNLGAWAAEMLPKLIGALVVLLLGWVIARGLSWGLGRVLDRMGLDEAAGRFAGEMMEKIGFEGSITHVLGRIVFWVVMLAFLMGVAEILGLEAVTNTIQQLFAYLPNVISAAIIVVLGVTVARLVGDVVSSGAAAANLTYASQLGSGVRGAFIVMVLVTVLEQLGVDTQIVQTVITALVAMVAVGLGLSFAFGSGDVVRGILAGHYIRQTLSEGDEVSVAGRRGRVERIGPVETLFRDDTHTWSIPNAQLLAEVIER